MARQKCIALVILVLVIWATGSVVAADDGRVVRPADAPTESGPIARAVGDVDDDGILDDGDGSGTEGDAPCTGGATTTCDDNCPNYPNPIQYDLDSDGIGDACDAHTEHTGSGSVTILTSRTFIKLTVDGDLTIASTGSVTHPAGDVLGLDLDVTGALTVEDGGSIDVTGKGLPGGSAGPQQDYNANPGQDCDVNGWAFNPGDTTGQPEDVDCTPNGQSYWAGRAGGASHAGYGGTGGGFEANAPYGQFENPIHLGAGGGAVGATPGSPGGGRVQITAGLIDLQGTIVADAIPTLNTWAGGGAGGSVLIDVGELMGSPTGMIRANGTSVGNGGEGAGGGGRIAVYYDMNTLSTSNYQARGGSGNSELARAGAGTVYLKDNAVAQGDLIVENGGVVAPKPTGLLTGLVSPTLGTLEVRDAAYLELTTGTLAITDELVLTTNGILVVRIGTTLEVSAGPLTIASGAHLRIDSGATLDSSGDIDVTISDGAILDLIAGSTVLPYIPTLSLTAGGTLNLWMLPAFGTLTNDGGILNPFVDLTLGAGDNMTAGGELNISSGTTVTLDDFNTTRIASGTVTVDAGGTLSVTSGHVTIGDGVTLIKDGTFGDPDEVTSLTVQSGGLITHSLRLLEGLVLNATGTVEIESGGLIDVTEKGLLGGRNGSAFAQYGESFDADGNIVGCCWVTGASHGGWGQNAKAAPGVPYGDAEMPQYLGSGGGGSLNGGVPGFHGGGRITIDSQDLIVDGELRATGGQSGTWVGSGSGGSILIQATGSISGAGTIAADGGTGPYLPGGGGRVALYFQTISLPTANVHAYAGVRSTGPDWTSAPTAGTVYLKSSSEVSGDLVLHNNGYASAHATPLRTQLGEFLRIDIQGSAALEVDSTVTGQLLVTEELRIDGADSKLTTSIRDLGGLDLKTPTLTLAAGGSIDVSGKGLAGGGDPANSFGIVDYGETYDDPARFYTIAPGSTLGTGGSYGGRGGGLGSAATYGRNAAPYNAGGGGGRTSSSTGTGGAGGSRVVVDAATCTIDSGSAVRADGAVGVTGSGSQGGGAGGGIRMVCLTLNGGGEITARGGSGSGTDGEGGGGGRIAVLVNNDNWTSGGGTIDLTGGSGVGAGDPGETTPSYIFADAVPPTVTAMNVMIGASNPGLYDRLEIEFSENLDGAPAAFNPAHVLLSGTMSGSHIPDSITFDTGTQVMTVTYPYNLPDDSYGLMLVSGKPGSGLCDSSGRALDGDYDSMTGLPSGDGAPRGDFIVGFGIDAPPWVHSVVPARGSTGVAPATNVSLRFTEALATGTVSATSVIVTDLTAGTTVPGSYSFNPVGDRVTLDPTTPLALGHLHRVDVTTDVTDMTAQPALLFSSVFRTSAIPPGERTLPSVSDALTGLGVSSGSGAAVARGGDLDGDGIDDLLVGAPAYATSGIVEAGAVGVYLGSTDAAERGAPDIIFEGVSAHDRSGTSIAGDFDFNDDGYSDILIGATQVNRTIDDDPVAGCDAGAPCGPGKVYVIFFDPTDTTTYPNLGTPSVADVIDLSRVANGLADEIPGLVLNGIALGDTAGFAVDGGASLNPDAIDDIAIGAPGVDGTGLTDSGVVYVVFGGTSVTGVHSLSEVGPPPPGVLGRVYRGELDGGRLGTSLALIGDVLAGGARAVSSGGELIMGAPFEDGQDDQSNPVPEGGVVYIEQGGNMDTDEVFVCSIGTTLPGIQVKGTQPLEHLGSSVDDGGDSRLNGVDDVLIGAPDYDVDLLADAGRVVQTSSQLATGVYLADEIGTTQDGVIWTGSDVGDGLGTAVAGVGDVTGDGVDDIVLGAPYADPVIQSVTYNDAGAVYLIEGQAPSSGTEGAISVSEVGVTVPGEVLVGTQVDELAGSAVAGAGDLDGNGDGDYVVGAPLHDVGGDLDSGIVYVVLESEPPPVPATGDCDAGGCLAIDVASGAMLNVEAGALSGPVTIGISSPGLGSLPGPPPAGSLLVGAVALTPDGLALNQAVDVYLPVLSNMLWQVADLEMFDLLCWSGTDWVDSGSDAIVGDSPFLPGEKAAVSQITTLATCAIFATDGDGDGVRDLLDNCSSISNASQADFDGNGVGDACGSSPRFRVSSDPLDMADFVTIQAAVDAVNAPGARIDVMPGMGAYVGTVIVDRDLALSIVGSANGGPITLEGSGGPGIDVVSTSGGIPIRVSGLILGGAAGIRAAVSTSIQDVTIDTVTGAALELTAGDHVVERVTIDGALDGVLLSAGATLELRDTSVVAATGAALQLDGSARIETVLVATSGQGITVGASGAATIAGSTVAAQSGAGIDGSSGGSVTLTRSIVYGNGDGDLVGVACTNVFVSLIGGVDCSASNGNLFADPLLDGGYRPGAGSPAIDAGVDPALYDGLPCNDLTGGPRLRDGDGDGLADGDVGAYEYVPPTAPPGEVADLVWADGATLSWQVNFDAVEYHVYRGELGSLAYIDFGSCRDDLDPVRTDESLTEAGDPPPGVGWFYQITAESIGGIEGSAGNGTCAERSRFAPCP